jgi:site-specific DNA-methyltransferase (adenine-specific)
MNGKYIVKVSSNPHATTHTLLTGDCVEKVDDIKEKVSLIITDPPYNRKLDYGPTFKDSMKKREYFDYLNRRIAKSVEVLKENGSIYIISYPEIAARLLPFLEDELKLTFRRWLTWHYPTNLGHSKKNFTRSQRTILFLTKSKSNDYIFNRENLIQHYKNPEVKKVRARIKNGSKGRTSYDLLRFLDLIELQKGMIDVLDFNLLKNVSKDRMRNICPEVKKQHPCQLPLDLLKLLIKVSSNEGDTVFDPFAGTFTTSKAASDVGRNSIGIELNEEFVKMGRKRLVQ